MLLTLRSRHYLKASVELGVDQTDLFATADLCEERDLVAVINHLVVLGNAVKKQRYWVLTLIQLSSDSPLQLVYRSGDSESSSDYESMGTGSNHESTRGWRASGRYERDGEAMSRGLGLDSTHR